jgi:hypothetical protein
MPTSLRAASLAAWGTALAQGHVPVSRAVEAVEDGDEPHLVVTHTFGEPDELAVALPALIDDGVLGFRLALPVPGDLLGLTGPPATNVAALAAGEAVVAVRHPHDQGPTVPMLVPEVRSFGPPGDQGHCVTWRLHPAAATYPDVPTLGQADRDLTHQVAASTAALAAIGAGSWRQDARELADEIRASAGTLRLPSIAGGRAHALAQRAVQVLAILDASRNDHTGVVTAHAAAARAASLAPLERAARRALVAATGAVLDSVHR